MKKVITLSTIMFIVIMSFTEAYADEFYVEEIGMSIELPDDMIGLSRYTTQEDIDSVEIDISADELIKYYEDSDIYLNGIPFGEPYEVVVTCIFDENQEKIFDYNQYSDKELMDLKDMLQEELGEFSSYTIEEIGQCKYVVLEFTNPYMQGIYTRQYSTVVNGAAVNIVLNTVSEIAIEEQKAMLDDIVATVKFDEIKGNPNKKARLTNGIDWYEAVKNGMLFMCLAGIGAIVYFFIIGKRANKKNSKTDDGNDSEE